MVHSVDPIPLGLVEATVEGVIGAEEGEEIVGFCILILGVADCSGTDLEIVS